MQTIGFIGLGAMGAAMAGNLRAAGYPLRVFNRNATRSAQFVQQFGAQDVVVCKSVAEVVEGASYVVSMVADDVATREVMLAPGGVLAAVRNKAGAAPLVIIDSSTNTPAMAREVAVAAEARGAIYLDAPVSGSMAQAKGRELVFMVGGAPEVFESVQPVLKAMGRMSRLMGPSGAGATIKLINNMISGALTAAIAEAVQVAEAAGIDQKAVVEVLGEGGAGSRLVKTKIPKIFARDFTAQFQLGLMEKDLRYFIAMAQDLDRPSPIASLVRSQMQAARRAGLGTLDSSAVFLQMTGEKQP